MSDQIKLSLTQKAFVCVALFVYAEKYAYTGYKELADLVYKLFNNTPFLPSEKELLCLALLAYCLEIGPDGYSITGAIVQDLDMYDLFCHQGQIMAEGPTKKG